MKMKLMTIGLMLSLFIITQTTRAQQIENDSLATDLSRTLGVNDSVAKETAKIIIEYKENIKLIFANQTSDINQKQLELNDLKVIRRRKLSSLLTPDQLKIILPESFELGVDRTTETGSPK